MDKRMADSALDFCEEALLANGFSTSARQEHAKALAAEARRARAAEDRWRQTANFFASAIKSGEPWSAVCVAALDFANNGPVSERVPSLFPPKPDDGVPAITSREHCDV